jgi:hypothetical protein
MKTLKRIASWVRLTFGPTSIELRDTATGAEAWLFSNNTERSE